MFLRTTKYAYFYGARPLSNNIIANLQLHYKMYSVNHPLVNSRAILYNTVIKRKPKARRPRGGSWRLPVDFLTITERGAQLSMSRKTLAAAFPYTLPVLMGYLSIGIVFGWMMAAIGYAPTWAAAMSTLIYAGSGQYLGVSLLSSAAPLADVALLTLIINFRHLVYGLSMLEKFRGMGWRKGYMMFSLTDETYALLAGVKPPEGIPGRDFYFAIALLDQLYWIAGSVLGAVAGALITIDTQGIDFAMTALFLVIAVEQWQSASRHLPVFLGAGGTLVCLLVLGAENGQFLVPALGILVAGLLLVRPHLDRKEEEA